METWNLRINVTRAALFRLQCDISLGWEGGREWPREAPVSVSSFPGIVEVEVAGGWHRNVNIPEWSCPESSWGDWSCHWLNLHCSLTFPSSQSCSLLSPKMSITPNICPSTYTSCTLNCLAQSVPENPICNRKPLDFSELRSGWSDSHVSRLWLMGGKRWSRGTG